MTHPTTKEELLAAIQTERGRLERKFADLTPEEMVWPGSMDDWSVKDILAHLVDWEQRFIDWYQAGRRGEVPHTPAPGMTWRDLPALNRQGFERHQDRPLDDVLADFHASYRQILALVEGMTAEEIFTPGTYAWTGKYNLVPWIEGNTSSHYNWARNQIRTTRIRKAFAASGT
jgi:hypothetical protein